MRTHGKFAKDFSVLEYFAIPPEERAELFAGKSIEMITVKSADDTSNFDKYEEEADAAPEATWEANWE